MSAAVNVVSCSSLGSVSGRESHRLVRHRGLEQVAHESGVAEAARAGLVVDQLADPDERIVGAVVSVLLAELHEDRTSSSVV
jgi:hypothetical protein